MPQEQQQIEVLCVCTPPRRIRPLRFRFEDAQHQLHVLPVTDILYEKSTQYLGIDALVYGCQVQLEGKVHLIELRYTVRSLQWIVPRVLY